MATYADLDDGNHVAGDDFDRLLTLSVPAASFAHFRMTVRKAWAKPGDDDNAPGPDLVATITDADGITVEDTSVIRCQIAGAALAVRPGRYVYSVQGTTALGRRVTFVRGILPLYPRGACG